MAALQMINSREQLLKLKRDLGVRTDWHEPDEQDVTARVFGVDFDNAGFWGPSLAPYSQYAEQHVVLYKEGEPVAAVNLATLFAWATGLEADVVEVTDEVEEERTPDGYRVVRAIDGRVMTRVMDIQTASSMRASMNKSSTERGAGALYRVEPYFRTTDEQEG